MRDDDAHMKLRNKMAAGVSLCLPPPQTKLLLMLQMSNLMAKHRIVLGQGERVDGAHRRRAHCEAH